MESPREWNSHIWVPYSLSEWRSEVLEGPVDLVEAVVPSGYPAVTSLALVRVPGETASPAPVGASVVHAVGPGQQLARQLVLVHVEVLAMVVEMLARYLSTMVDWVSVAQATAVACSVLLVPTDPKDLREATLRQAFPYPCP